MKTIMHTLIIGLGCCIHFSCNTIPSGKSRFKVEILDTTGNYKYKNNRNWKNLMKRHEYEQKISPIYSIKHGVDSFEVRLEILDPWDRSYGLYIVKFIDTGWIGQLVLHKYDTISNVQSLEVDRWTPKLGWNLFMDSLKQLGLYNLPSQVQINGLQDNISDGNSYTIEFATKDIYRRITYHEPRLFTDSINKRFWNIILFWNRNIKLNFGNIGSVGNVQIIR